jgi:putative transposase
MGEEAPMPWHETCVMDERMALMVDWNRGEHSVSELCRHYGVSRRVAYKWRQRYESEGIDGLTDRSRAPHLHPNAMSEAVEEALLEFRRRHPGWGAKKTRARLGRDRPEVSWPAESTIAALFARHGLVKPQRRRRRVAPSGPLSACAAANDVWGIDFKGWVVLGNGRRCDPLTVSDLATRYILRLQALERPDGEEVWPLVDAAFREFGLPRVMRSDNGPPFASTGAGGLSRLAVRLIKAGVVPERIAPARPQENGRHERMHRTLKEEAMQPPAYDARAQQRRFDAFRRTFNEERPHEALGQAVPADRYRSSERRYSGRLREPDYADEEEVRRVRSSGEIKWRGERIFISEALIGEPVGLAELAEGAWAIRYGPVALGVIDEQGRFRRLAAGFRRKPKPQPPGQGVTHVPG